VLAAWAIDQRRVLRGILQTNVRRDERLATIYLLSLVALSVTFNLVFLFLYMIGRYYPPFGHVPTRF
jgi:hypothetical protein